MADQQHQHHHMDAAEKEKKRKKQVARMGKMVAKAWELPNADPFHTDPHSSNILCLTAIGKKLDEEGYRFGKHGWEDFARDIGGVYNRHISKKTKHAKIAKEHRAQVCSWLAKKDESLEQIAKKHIPGQDDSPKQSGGNKSKKRKASTGGKDDSAAKRRNLAALNNNKTKDPNIIEREENALRQLREFVKDKGASESVIDGYRSRVTRKPSDGRYDTNFFNPEGRRFRSMLDVGRFLGLISADEPRQRSAAWQKMKKKAKTTSREVETAKRKLRNELDKLRRQHTKATKDLDEFVSNDKESRYPVEDLLLQEEQSATSEKLSPSNCAAARIPDVEDFAGIPSHCVPDVLVAWDFLCTFSRVLSLAPIGLDDFVYALTYMPPRQLAEGDQFSFPPVYIGEAHLALLKLLLADPSSDDWWWSILDEDELEKANTVVDIQEVASKEETDVPLIKIDFAGLLAFPEEALITQSWVQSLEAVRTLKVTDKESIKSSIRASMNLVANKYVLAYLRKALKLGKTSGVGFMKRAVVWLIDRVKEARPELFERGVSRTEINKKRAKVVEEVELQMEKLGGAALKVDDEDLASDAEDSDDESDEESDDEDATKEEPKLKSDTLPLPQESPDDRPASHIPPRPLPTLVDLMLPPEKPLYNSDLLNPCTWTLITGAAAERILHRYKRVRNELDDSLREFQDLSPLTIAERRRREELAATRVFSECFVHDGKEDPAQKAADHLCAGGDYLDLSIVQRLCILRVLIEAAYDTKRVFEVVDSNYKQRTNAIKALAAEQRKAKKEAKEKAIDDENLAREDLAYEAKNNFLEEKREEIRKANESSQELTNEEIDGLTEDDIIEFDDDIKADFEALPGPESFKKAEVMERVNILQETSAFSTDLLTVMNMDELVEKEAAAIKAMETELAGLGGEEALMNPSLDRETVRNIEKLRRDIIKAREVEASLPLPREAAIEQLKDAMADGTIKSLRGAIRTAKNARLFGPDDETNGVWTLDIVRDAHMELENAKQLKRVADAQKDLVSKLNKCFIRTEPLGEDRFRNRFWQFESGEKGHIWAEVDYIVQNDLSENPPRPGFLDLRSNIENIKIGADEMEEDLAPMDEEEDPQHFQTFIRKEHHVSGKISSLVKRHWGCHVNETSLRTVMKGLDSRGLREDKLKKNLKEALEDKTISSDSKEGVPAVETEEAVEEAEAAAEAELRKEGDETYFRQAKEKAQMTPTDSIDLSKLEALSSGIGARVRVRFLVEKTKEGEIVRYEVGSITAWKLKVDKSEDTSEDVDMTPADASVPIWRAWTDRGSEAWLTGTELLESITRFELWSKSDAGYFESDAAFLAYRNSLGRHLGKAAEAAQGATPFRLAQYMVTIEGDIYSKLKHAFYDNTWGGKNGSRNAWIASMKDFAFEFQTVRDGLLTLEKAFFDITGGFPGEDKTTRSGRELLDDPTARPDIELESMPEAGKSLGSIWSSRESRAVFLEIIQTCKTTGILALGLELVCRNTLTYLDANKLLRAKDTSRGTARTSRQQQSSWQSAVEPASYGGELPSRRAARRVNYKESDYNFDDLE